MGFLLLDPSDIDGETSEKRAGWLSNTAAIPDYLSETARLKILAVRTAVHKRLSSPKVDAVIEVLLRLDENQ